MTQFSPLFAPYPSGLSQIGFWRNPGLAAAPEKISAPEDLTVPENPAPTPLPEPKPQSVSRWHATAGKVFNSRTWQSLPTWSWEMLGASLPLLAVALTTSDYTNPGQAAANWLGSAALLSTFGYIQVNDRIQAASSATKIPQADHSIRWSQRYYWAKEFLWGGVFALTGAYTALVGPVIFLSYPFWRSFYTKARDSQRPPATPPVS